MARSEGIPDHETSSHISPASFVDHYLRLPDFPSDVIQALESRDLNLFAAEQLARVTAIRLGVSLSQAKRTRSELPSSHLQTKASCERLRQRVDELLRASSAKSGEIGDELDTELADLEDFNPYDSTHLFWEQLKQLGFAFRTRSRTTICQQLSGRWRPDSRPSAYSSGGVVALHRAVR